MPIEQPPSTASYIVFIKGDKCYAKNGMTGHIEFGPGDASTVIQSAINALGTAGGKIFIKAGSYSITSSISTSTSKISLVGEGASTILTINVGGSGNYGLTFYGGNIVISGLYLKSTDGSSGIKIRDNSNVLIEKTTFESLSYGIYSWGSEVNVIISRCIFTSMSSPSIFIDGSKNIAVHNCIFRNCNSIGVYVAGSPYNVEICGNIFVDVNLNLQYYAPIVVRPTGNGSQVLVTNNIIKFTTNPTVTANGILISGEYSSAYSITRFIVVGNILDGGAFSNCNAGIYLHGYSASYLTVANGLIENNHAHNWKYGIVLTYCTDIAVIANKIENCSSAAIYISASTNYIIRHNIGYVTENCGTATFSGDGTTTTFAIAHELAGTPKSWRVEAGSADAKGNKYVTADATNLYVTFATAPPSGTNNVVLVWSAEM
jgi:parallel beta-helix repeat protein